MVRTFFHLFCHKPGPETDTYIARSLDGYPRSPKRPLQTTSRSSQRRSPDDHLRNARSCPRNRFFAVLDLDIQEPLQRTCCVLSLLVSVGAAGEGFVVLAEAGPC